MAAMTIEEAGQEILQGPYTECRRCAGRGWPSVKDKNTNFFNICKSCKGTQKWLRGDYLLACVVLGIDPPERLKAVTEWKFDGMSDSIDFKVWDYALSDAQASAEYMKNAYAPPTQRDFSIYGTGPSTFKKAYVMWEWCTNDD